MDDRVKIVLQMGNLDNLIERLCDSHRAPTAVADQLAIHSKLGGNNFNLRRRSVKYLETCLRFLPGMDFFVHGNLIFN